RTRSPPASVPPISGCSVPRAARSTTRRPRPPGTAPRSTATDPRHCAAPPDTTRSPPVPGRSTNTSPRESRPWGLATPDHRGRTSRRAAPAPGLLPPVASRGAQRQQGDVVVAGRLDTAQELVGEGRQRPVGEGGRVPAQPV